MYWKWRKHRLPLFQRRNIVSYRFVTEPHSPLTFFENCAIIEIACIVNRVRDRKENFYHRYLSDHFVYDLSSILTKIVNTVNQIWSPFTLEYYQKECFLGWLDSGIIYSKILRYLCRIFSISNYNFIRVKIKRIRVLIKRSYRRCISVPNLIKPNGIKKESCESWTEFLHLFLHAFSRRSLKLEFFPPWIRWNRLFATKLAEKYLRRIKDSRNTMNIFWE